MLNRIIVIDDFIDKNYQEQIKNTLMGEETFNDFDFPWFYNDDVTEIDRHFINKGNRLIMFDAHLPHQAQPVSRLCFQLRTCIVFKTNRV